MPEEIGHVSEAAQTAVCARQTPKQFQEKCETVFRPELRENKKIERICEPKKS